jgi:hypothetical protein
MTTTNNSLQYYTFNNTDRIGADFTDKTMKTISNDCYMTHMLSNFHDISNKSYVDFAIQQPTITFGANSHGNGLNGDVIDIDSELLIKTNNERPLEKVNLIQRPFLTIPYLGKSLGDPVIESQLQQGEVVNEKKSISTIMDKSFLEYSLYVTDDKMNDRVQNPSKNVEEYALDGWIRGGSDSRNNNN